MSIVDLTIQQGATFQQDTQPLLLANGSPDSASLTNATAKMMLRTNFSDPSPLLTLTSPSGGLTINPSIGTVTILMTATQTGLLQMGPGFYTLNLTKADGVTVLRLQEGVFRVQPTAAR